MENNHDSRSLQMEGSFRQSLISSSFDEDGYEARGRLDTSTESLLSNIIENTESLETDVEDEETESIEEFMTDVNAMSGVYNKHQERIIVLEVNPKSFFDRGRVERT